MRISEIAVGVHFVEGEAVNWTIVADGGGLTLIDAGYPGDAGHVLESIRRIGRSPEELRAILVTHAHVDHVGAIPQLLKDFPVPVLSSAREAAHIRREFLEQATPKDIALNLWRPRMVGWVRHIVANGALRDVAVPTASAVPEGGPLDLPGRPVPLLVPGHTSGHTCYLLPDARALVSGDALVSGHWLSRSEGPQLLLDFFHHDRAQAAASLDVLAAADADVVLPGHGPVLRAAPAAAVSQARRSR